MIKKHLFCLLLFLTVAPMVVHAQYGFDWWSVEELIKDHKGVRSKLAARSALEQANELLHQYSSEANVEYDSLNVKLDKYTKCFDIIDIIYNSGVTVVNVRNTYNDVSEKISQLESLIEDFAKDYTLNGNILSSDTIIINACRNAVTQVTTDGSQLVNSLIEIAQYAAGLRGMTSENLLTVIASINENLDNIRGCIDHTYYVVWKYITIRRNYFKRTLYRAKTIREMAHDSFSRWKRATQEVGY